MITGGDELASKFARLGRSVPARVQAEAVPEVADHVLEQAKELVPVRTGQLRDSGFVRTGPDGAEVGFSAPHAVSIHERTDLPHENGQAKFLEQPLFAAQGQLEQAVADAVNRELQ